MNKDKFSLKDHGLEVYVARFQGSESGKIYVSASFSVLNAQGLRIKTVSRQLETRQVEPGYDAMVFALRAGFDRICHEAILDLKESKF